MKQLALVLFIIGVFLYVTAPASAQVPPRPEQPRPDLFSCGTLTCDHYNPVTKKAKAERTVNYRLLTMPGCSAGTIPADMVRLEAELAKVQFRLVRNDSLYDFTVRINCGSTHIAVCGSVNVFCLNRGYPYSADVDISDILSTYFPETRLSILCHEICGHALGSWNEQYATCGASCGFAPSPNWYDFMNTGPLSRHGFEGIELERWERTMYLLQVPNCYGETDPSWGGTWNNCTGLWEGPDSYPWNYSPTRDEWFDRQGASEWCCTQPYGGIYNRRLGDWFWTVTSTWRWSESDPTWRCAENCP